jgi:hypothetical protein
MVTSHLQHEPVPLITSLPQRQHLIIPQFSLPRMWPPGDLTFLMLTSLFNLIPHPILKPSPTAVGELPEQDAADEPMCFSLAEKLNS